MPKREAFDLSEVEDSEDQASEQQKDSDDSGSSDDSVERPSPSLYRKERADAKDSQDDRSSQEEDDIDEDELEMHSMSNLSATPGVANQDLASQFAELSRMFANVCEQN